MAGREMEAIVRISGNLDASLRQAIEQAAKQIEDLGDVTESATAAIDAISATLDEQKDALKAAKKQYASYILNGEKGSEQAKELAKKIKQLSGAIKDNEADMRSAEAVADLLDATLEDVGEAARDSKSDFTVMKGAISNLISSGIQNLIGACSNAVSSIFGLADSTREFRQDQATLEAAFDSAGFSAEQAADTWEDLYAIFGEDDRAVEAANNISRMADSQAELDKWTRITTGVWGTYQDALPVESLAEAAGETAKVGTVTGAMADALNWSSKAAEMFAGYMSKDVTTAEDAFNVALSECTGEAERQALITETLTALYGSAADAYDETAGGLMNANRVNARYNKTLAEMGERIEPTTVAVKEGMTGLLDTVLELTEGVDMESLTATIQTGFEKVGGAIEWVSENGAKLLPVVGALTAAFVTYKAASLGAAAAEAIKTAVLATGATTVSAATIATWALNSAIAFLTSPITLTVAAIAALTAGVIWLYQNWDTAKVKVQEFGATVNEIWAGIANWVTGAIDHIGQYFPIFGGYLAGWWSSIQDVVGNVQAIFGGLIDFISNVFAGNWSAAWQNIVDIFGNLFGAIANIAKAPINGVVGAINAVINGINGIGFTIPDWVPVVGGKSFALDIPNIPMLAKGGFTDGVSIAGEAGTEAVISFDRSVREANLGYWAKAGRLLGATAEDAGFALSGNSGGDTVIDMGGVTFAPNITFSGKADKESVVKAIEDEYPEFLDMLERWLIERGAVIYG